MSTQAKPTTAKKDTRCLDDDYMMYKYKVIPCSRVSTHNWKLCHFSHVGEVAARRRYPSCHLSDLCVYVSANKDCPLGDSCTYAHNAFESWLHPDRYKTTLCSYAGACTRKFCFFAHSANELRNPAKQHLIKTSSLDTPTSVGTPDSSSSSSNTSNLSSRSIMHNATPGWSPATTNSSAAIKLAKGSPGAVLAQGSSPGLCMPACHPQHSSANTVCFFPSSMQCQGQQHMVPAAAGVVRTKSNLVKPPGLTAAVTGTAGHSALDTQVLLTPPACAAPASSHQAAMLQLLDSLTIGGMVPTSIGAAAVSITADGSQAGFLFGSPNAALDLPLMNAGAVVAGHSALLQASGMQVPGVASNWQLAGLQPSLGGLINGDAQQQQQIAQLRQALQLQLLQAQQLQQQQSQQISLDRRAELLGLNQTASVSLNSQMALMLNLSTSGLHDPLFSTLSAAGQTLQPPGLAHVSHDCLMHPAAGVAGVGSGWNLGTLLQDQQLHLHAQMGPQLEPGMQGFVATQESLNDGSKLQGSSQAFTVKRVSGTGGETGDAAIEAANAVQLQQQLKQLTFAMAQPA